MIERIDFIQKVTDLSNKPRVLIAPGNIQFFNFRNEPSNSPPGKKLLIKSDSSTPELTGSPSDHYEWPEIEIENANGKKINILQNITVS